MRIQNGARRTKLKHTDYDFLKSHRFGIAQKPKIPDEYLADAGLTMPNQLETDSSYTPPVPIMPTGCTDYAQSELYCDLYNMRVSPTLLENVTHANAKGGIDIRTSMDACLPASSTHPERLGWFGQYFNIRASGVFDFFDAFRLAQVVGISVAENRSITWGTPWFPSWEQALLNGKSIMPMPTSGELAAARDPYDTTLPWHDSKLDGWTRIDGVLVYRDKSWQGNAVGDKGFVYFPREVINMVMSITGTVGYTASKNKDIANPITVDLPLLQWIVSVLRQMIQRYIPFGARFV